jgi:hypothetical protein
MSHFAIVLVDGQSHYGIIILYGYLIVFYQFFLILVCIRVAKHHGK